MDAPVCLNHEHDMRDGTGMLSDKSSEATKSNRNTLLQ